MSIDVLYDPYIVEKVVTSGPWGVPRMRSTYASSCQVM